MKTAEEEKMYSILAKCNHTSKSYLYGYRNIGIATIPSNNIKAMKEYASEVTTKKDELIEAQKQLIKFFIKTYLSTTEARKLLKKIKQLEKELK